MNSSAAAATTTATPAAKRAAATASTGGPSVAASQDALFFPLPITGGIENIVQFTNKENTKLAFKVRSTIKQRYAVKPTLGFLHPKEETIVKFLLDPLAMTVDGQVPDENTKDTFLVDFAFVSAEDDVASSVDKSRSSSSAVINAAAFWKKYHDATPPGGITRKKLPCVYIREDQVPKSLTVHTSTASAMSPVAFTATTASTSSSAAVMSPQSTTHFSSGQKGRATPSAKANSTALQNATTFEAATAALMAGSSSTPTTIRSATPPFTEPTKKPINNTVTTASSAVSSGSGSSNLVAVTAASSATALPSAAASSSMATSATATATSLRSRTTPVQSCSPEDVVGPVPPKHGSYFKTFLFFTIPVPLVLVLLLLSFVVALAEEPSAVSALITALTGGVQR